MRRAGAGLVIAAALLVVGAVGARGAAGAFNSSPGFGKPGTTITVSSNATCAPPEGADDPFVVVGLLDEVDDAIVEEAFDVSESGSWSGTLTVPPDAENGTYAVAAECFPDEESDAYFAYSDNSFTVGDPPATTTTAPSTAAADARRLPSTGDEDALPQAKPAVAVVAQPRFTG